MEGDITIFGVVKVLKASGVLPPQGVDKMGWVSEILKGRTRGAQRENISFDTRETLLQRRTGKRNGAVQHVTYLGGGQVGGRGGSGWGAERADGCCAFVELEIARLSLVALRHQPHLNPKSRSYSVYGLIISTNYHYSIHNISYLTLNCLDLVATPSISSALSAIP